MTTQTTPVASESRHTPGPWHLSPDGYSILCGDEHDPEIIAWTDVNDVMMIQDNRTVEANARLIAAAPELLEALKAITDMGEAIHATQTLRAAYHHAKDVIAKAEGR